MTTAYHHALFNCFFVITNNYIYADITCPTPGNHNEALVFREIAQKIPKKVLNF